LSLDTGKLRVNAKNQVDIITPAQGLNILHCNIEGLAVAGRLADITTNMEDQECRVGICSECWIKDNAFFVFNSPTREGQPSRSYGIFQSGAVGTDTRATGVCFIIRADFLPHVLGFQAISGRHAVITVRVRGGTLAIVGVYLPYYSATESEAEEDRRMAAFTKLTDIIDELKRRGPVLVIGDFNTSIRYKLASEAWCGNFLFARPGQQTVFDDDEVLEDEEVGSNRELLGELCTATQMVCKNTFLQKPENAKITFFR
jgi:hypothetical protein